MTEKTANIEKRLFMLATMVQEHQQEFKIGDVVESQNNVVAPVSTKGIIILEYTDDRPPDYDVYWYNSGVISVIREDLRHCKGIEHKRLCLQCEYDDICPNLGDIVRCDLSEFGEWRAEGERDFSVCRQRECKHLDVCQSINWFPKSV